VKCLTKILIVIHGPLFSKKEKLRQEDLVWEDEILKLYADNIPAYIGNEVINPSTENELGNVLATVLYWQLEEAIK
jgi:hypothetical protein